MKQPTSTPDAETKTNEQDTADQIRARAYELYELRGRAEGHELDDWLLAESQLIPKSQAKDS